LDRIFENNKIPNSQARQILFTLEYLKGKTHREIAEKYNMKRITVTSAIIKAKRLYQYNPPFKRRLEEMALKCKLKNSLQKLEK
jgi:DNA-binding transcriptional regulator LsrR (DeoR family)